MSAGDAAALLSALDVAQVVARSLEIDRDQLRAAVGACQPIDSLSAAMRVLDPAPDERAPADPEADFVRQIEDVLYPDRAGAFLRRAQARGGA